MRESFDSQKAVFATGAEHVPPMCQRGACRRQAGTGGTATAPVAKTAARKRCRRQAADFFGGRRGYILGRSMRIRAYGRTEVRPFPCRVVIETS
ncbi:MAG: hypothetical protein K5787_18160 [Lentisphaeria bacterium]|nr:hypothetical protein [Lentisphaeria bacterium]